MNRYIALIRGINVGGNNKVSMPLLKTEFELAGFQDVLTYINSGNVVFRSNIAELAELVRACERILIEKFDVDTKVAVISVPEFHEAVKNAPEWWGSDPESKHNALFVIAPARADEIMKEVGDTKPEYEKVAAYQHVIFWSAPLETFNRTRWSKIVGTTSYNKITIRNANTVRKLRDLTV